MRLPIAVVVNVVVVVVLQIALAIFNREMSRLSSPWEYWAIFLMGYVHLGLVMRFRRITSLIAAPVYLSLMFTITFLVGMIAMVSLYGY